MKQHRPRVSEENYQHVMSHLAGRFGENETFDNALWLLLTEHEDLKRAEEGWDDVVELLRKELNNVTDLLIDKNNKYIKSRSSEIAGYFAIAGLLIYIGFCL